MRSIIRETGKWEALKPDHNCDISLKKNLKSFVYRKSLRLSSLLGLMYQIKSAFFFLKHKYFSPSFISGHLNVSMVPNVLFALQSELELFKWAARLFVWLDIIAIKWTNRTSYLPNLILSGYSLVHSPQLP